jgi:hypothetical protein
MKNTTSQKTFFGRFTLTLMITLLSTGFLTSCSEDDEAVNPQDKAAFLGTYQVEDKNSEEDATFHFQLQITESSKGGNKVDLKNFRYINNGLNATIKGNKLNISQVFEDSDEKVEVNGSGTLNGDVLNYSYKIVLKEKGKSTRVFENTAEATRIE